MRKVSKRLHRVILLSIITSLSFPTVALADATAPEIIDAKALTTEVYVGKKWTQARFEVVVKDQSLNLKTSKSFLKSTNSQRKDISCSDSPGSHEKTIAGDFFVHNIYILCQIQRNTEVPDIRSLQFTVTDSSGLSSTYNNDVFNAKVSFILGFDPKLIEQSQTDAGKIQLVQECTNYERLRLDTLETYKTVAKFPKGNPFEAKYKEGKTALTKPFTCNLGPDLLMRVSDYEDLANRLFIGPGGTASYQTQLLLEKLESMQNTSITCVKGKITKVVKGLKAKCPKGYKKR